MNSRSEPVAEANEAPAREEADGQLRLTQESPISVMTVGEDPNSGLSIGSVFAGRYQILEKVGKGGMARVYRALDTEINETVALKVVKP